MIIKIRYSKTNETETYQAKNRGTKIEFREGQIIISQPNLQDVTMKYDISTDFLSIVSEVSTSYAK